MQNLVGRPQNFTDISEEFEAQTSELGLQLFTYVFYMLLNFMYFPFISELEMNHMSKSIN